MIFRLLATLVVAIHLAFVVFVVLGGVLALRWRGVAWIHVPAVLWGALIEFAGWVCPLTPLENWLRRRGGLAGYDAGFIENYLLQLLYPDGLSRSIQWTLGTIVLLINVIVYWFVYHRD